jgi:hypothetical protein
MCLSENFWPPGAISGENFHSLKVKAGKTSFQGLVNIDAAGRVRFERIVIANLSSVSQT